MTSQRIAMHGHAHPLPPDDHPSPAAGHGSGSDPGTGSDSDSDAGASGQPTMLRLTVASADDGVRLDKLIAMRAETLFSRTTAARQIQDGHVRVNDRACTKASLPVREGDRIEVDLPEPPPPTLAPEPLPLDIVWEDDDLLLVNKPPFLATHPPRTQGTGTLANALAYHIRKLSNFHQDPTRVGIVHRLDRDTSGIILVAKDEWVHRRISRQFQRRQVTKQYIAVVHGMPDLDEYEVEAPIARHPKHREMMRTVADLGDAPDARDARTRFVVRERLDCGRHGRFAVLDAHPQTGRTHQIRVHAQHLGHPIVADEFYAGNRRVPRYADFGLPTPADAQPPFVRAWKGETLPPREAWPILVRHALHAVALEFEHPRRRERMRFEAPLAADIARLLEVLRTHAA